MKSKKIKAAVFGTLICVMLTWIALLLPPTLGKYGSEIDGYINFNIGSFNAAITPVADATTSKYIEFRAKDFNPGMNSKELNPELAEDTAVSSKFRVANGNSASDAASTPLKYTVRIRTSNSLPLKYTLKSTMVDAGGNESFLYSPSLSEPNVIEKELSEPRYEYIFNKADEASEGGAENGGVEAVAEGDGAEGGSGGGTEGTGGSEGTGGEGGEPTPEYEEIEFVLEQGVAANPYVFREHELIAEWSSDIEYAKSEYMKEVEIVEILVTVISLNKSEDENYKFPETPNPGGYADGMIVILPSEGGADKIYTYDIDLRSLKKESTGSEPLQSAFNISMHNGFGLGLKDSDPLGADYTLTLKVPAEIVEATGDKNWTFSLYRSDLNEETPTDFLEGVTPKYRLYDLKETEESKKFVEYTDRSKVPAIDEKEENSKKLYYIYEIDLGESGILYYKDRNNVGGYDIASKTHVLTLKANNFADTKDEVAFLNKLELTINASFIPTPGGTPAPSPEPTPEETPAE